MNSLVNYDSDDDGDDVPDHIYEPQGGSSSKSYRKHPSSGSISVGTSQQDDTNYDEVQMSLSEDSDGGETQCDNNRKREGSRDISKSDNGSRHRREEKDDRKSSRRDKRSRSRDRYDKYNRDRDRKERRRSRSPRERRRSRSRSRSRGRGYSKRYDKSNNNRDRFNNSKLDNGANSQQTSTEVNDGSDQKDRFFMPGITGRFRDQIEKRKLLWQKNKEPEKQTKVWETTTFAQDQDGKVANKFKRLMGIKGAAEGGSTQTDVLKKQEEMFSSMEAQYEVARTTTHTMRGVGLGFGSYQR